MHELGIVFHIIDSLKEVGEENHLKQIAGVTLEVGKFPEFWKIICKAVGGGRQTEQSF